MDWSRYKVIEFINRFRSMEILWDHKHPHFKDRHKRRDALAEIAAEFETEKSEIEKKIRNLQSQFGRELRLMREHQEDGKTYDSKWFAFNKLTFLLNSGKRTIKGKRWIIEDEVC